MDRRNFLKGTFGGITAGGILIAAANTDIEAFATGLHPEATVDVATLIPNVPYTGEFVFNSAGQPIGIIKSIQHLVDTHKVESLDGTVYHYPGLRGIEFTVQSYGAFNLAPLLHQRTK